MKTILGFGFIAIWLISPVATYGQATKLSVETRMAPPEWALLERELLRANTAACQEFFARYFDERGYLLCVERWGGDDGPDDAIENCNDGPLLHALGAPEVVRSMYQKAWEGHFTVHLAPGAGARLTARMKRYSNQPTARFPW